MTREAVLLAANGTVRSTLTVGGGVAGQLAALHVGLRTALVTCASVDSARIATRAPSRAALVSTCQVW